MTPDLRIPPGCRIVPGGPDKDPDTGTPAILVQTDDGAYAFFCPRTNGFINYGTAAIIGRELDAKAKPKDK